MWYFLTIISFIFNGDYRSAINKPCCSISWTKRIPDCSPARTVKFHHERARMLRPSFLSNYSSFHRQPIMRVNRVRLMISQTSICIYRNILCTARISERPYSSLWFSRPSSNRSYTHPNRDNSAARSGWIYIHIVNSGMLGGVRDDESLSTPSEASAFDIW